MKTENIKWLIELLFKFRSEDLADLIDDGKLMAYDRFGRFGAASPEQCEAARERIAHHVESMRSPLSADEYVHDYESEHTERTILTLSGFDEQYIKRLELRGKSPKGRKALRQMPQDERAKEALKQFREFGGRRPKDTAPGPGTRGALARLSEVTGIHRKNLGALLDRAIDIERRSRFWNPMNKP